MNKTFRLYILFALFSTMGIFSFADEPGSALDDKPSVNTAAIHPSYLYDLKKLIEKSRENIKEVNVKIKEQAVLKRNQKREERAREYYEKGVALTGEGKLDEARDYFEKAIRITGHPEMAGYIRESQRRLKKQESALHAQEREHYHQIKHDESTRKQDVEAAYKEAVDLYKQKKYHPAKDAFEHVDEIAPDYRATGSYLKILDQDIITADALAAKQQAVEIARQQKEAEAARAKEKAMWLAQIEEKEKERKDAIYKQAEDVYDQAVVLYKRKKFAEAKKKFEEVSWVIPDYKATIKYLGRIDKDAEVEQERAARQQQKALQEQRWEEEVQRKKQGALRQRELKAKELQHQRDLQEQAQFLYTAAVSLFNKRNMDGALEKFNDIEKLYPGFKSARIYMARIDQWKFDQQRQEEEQRRQQKLTLTMVTKEAHIIAKAAKVGAGLKPSPTVVKIPVARPPQHPVLSWFKSVLVPSAPAAKNLSFPKKAKSTMPAQVKPAVSLEDQQKQARDIAALAEKSSQLYRQIADISDNKYTVQTKRKMADLEHLLFQMREEQWKRQQKESKARQAQRGAKAIKIYQQGREYLRSHDYAKAKIEFLALENIIPDYKATRHYLSRIEKEQKQAGIEAVRIYEQKEAEHLEREQQAFIKELAQKASDINDDIIRLSAQQDYGAMKVKFTELEKTVTALTTLKGEMAKQKGRQERERQRQKKLTEALERQKRLYEEDRLLQLRKILPKPKPAAVVPPAISSKQVQAQIDFSKLEARRKAVRKQLEDGVEAMYQKALSLYKQGNYTAAADRFKDVQDILAGYKRAAQYMDEARLKSLTVKPQAVNVSPEASAVSASPSVSRQDAVAKVLDLFDPDVQ